MYTLHEPCFTVSAPAKEGSLTWHRQRMAVTNTCMDLSDQRGTWHDTTSKWLPIFSMWLKDLTIETQIKHPSRLKLVSHLPKLQRWDLAMQSKRPSTHPSAHTRLPTCGSYTSVIYDLHISHHAQSHHSPRTSRLRKSVAAMFSWASNHSKENGYKVCMMAFKPKGSFDLNLRTFMMDLPRFFCFGTSMNEVESKTTSCIWCEFACTASIKSIHPLISILYRYMIPPCFHVYYHQYLKAENCCVIWPVVANTPAGGTTCGFSSAATATCSGGWYPSAHRSLLSCRRSHD